MATFDPPTVAKPFRMTIKSRKCIPAITLYPFSDKSMRSEKSMKFDYGDEVVIRTKDDAGNAAEKRCAVVGVTSVDGEEQARHFKYPVGTVLYTVEFGDGTDALVSEEDLRPAGRGPEDANLFDSPTR